MNEIFSRADQTQKRRKLRRNLSPVEVLLWAQLKGKAMDGVKFRRQHSVGPYVLDFYCPRAKLAIEIDGAQHFEDQETIMTDRDRQRSIEYYGITFLRFTGKEVTYEIEGVLERIHDTLTRLSPPSVH